MNIISVCDNKTSMAKLFMAKRLFETLCGEQRHSDLRRVVQLVRLHINLVLTEHKAIVALYN